MTAIINRLHCSSSRLLDNLLWTRKSTAWTTATNTCLSCSPSLGCLAAGVIVGGRVRPPEADLGAGRGPCRLSETRAHTSVTSSGQRRLRVAWTQRAQGLGATQAIAMSLLRACHWRGRLHAQCTSRWPPRMWEIRGKRRKRMLHLSLFSTAPCLLCSCIPFRSFTTTFVFSVALAPSSRCHLTITSSPVVPS